MIPAVTPAGQHQSGGKGRTSERFSCSRPEIPPSYALFANLTPNLSPTPAGGVTAVIALLNPGRLLFGTEHPRLVTRHDGQTKAISRCVGNVFHCVLSSLGDSRLSSLKA